MPFAKFFFRTWGVTATGLAASNYYTSSWKKQQEGDGVLKGDDQLGKIFNSVAKGIIIGSPIVFFPLILRNTVYAVKKDDSHYLKTPFIYQAQHHPIYSQYTTHMNDIYFKKDHGAIFTWKMYPREIEKKDKLLSIFFSWNVYPKEIEKKDA